MSEIYRLLTDADWQVAQAAGAIEPNALDRRDGYLHLSPASLVLDVANRYFSAHDRLIALRFAAADLAPHVRWEVVYPDQPPYPHVYAPRIALDRVRQVRSLARNIGAFDWA